MRNNRRPRRKNARDVPCNCAYQSFMYYRHCYFQLAAKCARGERTREESYIFYSWDLKRTNRRELIHIPARRYIICHSDTKFHTSLSITGGTCARIRLLAQARAGISAKATKRYLTVMLEVIVVPRRRETGYLFKIWIITRTRYASLACPTHSFIVARYLYACRSARATSCE